MDVDGILRAKGASVVTIRPDETIADLVRGLRDQRIGAMVVSEDGRSVVGIISERDVVHAFAAHRAATSEIKVAEVMTRDVITCRREDDLTRILGVMTRHRVRHLPVLEGGRMVGLVSIGDAVKHRLAELETETAVLRDAYIAGH